jgi:hypothetical protein
MIANYCIKEKKMTNKKLRRVKKRTNIAIKKFKRSIRNYRNILKFRYGNIITRTDPKPVTVIYDGDRSYKFVYRNPTEKEVIKYRQTILKSMYIDGEMSRSAYYTLKGMNRRNNNVENVTNFIRNRHPEYIDLIHAYATIKKAYLEMEYSIGIATETDIDFGIVTNA